MYAQGTWSGFLSTPSARRATRVGNEYADLLFISIHALREEGDWTLATQPPRSSNFYPRPPRGGRLVLTCRMIALKLFLSTPSARRATRHQRSYLYRFQISIHALREEGDTKRKPPLHPAPLFLSTPSARRATGCGTSFCCLWSISIHALREEGDTLTTAAICR